jgi:hypothetical protein
MLLKDFLKKFIKYMATGPNTGSSLPYFKLLHITENLCKTNRQQTNMSLSGLFVKSLFSDGLLENEMIKREILSNDAPDQIEEIFKVRLSDKLRGVISQVQAKV